MDSPKSKRPRIEDNGTVDDDSDVAEVSSVAWTSATKIRASRAPISPPPSRKAKHRQDAQSAQSNSGSQDLGKVPPRDAVLSYEKIDRGGATRFLPSPFRLSKVEGLADDCNVDAISLRDILGDAMIKECWLFNYLFDVDFVMYVLLLAMLSVVWKRKLLRHLRSLKTPGF